MIIISEILSRNLRQTTSKGSNLWAKALSNTEEDQANKKTNQPSGGFSMMKTSLWQKLLHSSRKFDMNIDRYVINNQLRLLLSI